jgi:hypothetical protein
MCDRSSALSPARRLAFLLLPLAFVLSTSSSAFAHKLLAKAVLLPVWQVQVESWFETDEPASEADIQVFGVSESPIVDGKLNARGIYIFRYEHVEPLRIVVNAGSGHRAVVKVDADTLRQHVLLTSMACVQPSPLLVAPLLVPVRLAESPSPAPVSLLERKDGGQIMNLVIGVAILLGVAMAAVMWKRMKQDHAPESRE